LVVKFRICSAGSATNMELKPQSSPINGRLWDARARDWANIQEGTVKAVLGRTGVGPGTRYLDVGCGAGRAVQLAAALGAQVSEIGGVYDIGASFRCLLARP
jgi:2-polyprenyl-3-methyl-5-hydroxy-6-metoxy-1,4-benzoquinol methylase